MYTHPVRLPNFLDVLEGYIHSAAEALAPPPVLDWCVEGLFTRPSLNILVGDAGSKKTYLALDLAVCVALGKPWLGRPVKPTPALFIDEEAGLSRIWARLHSVLHSHKAGPQTPLHYSSLSGFDLRSWDDCLTIIQEAQTLGVGFIVIDALANVMHGGDENAVPSVQPVLLNLRRLSESTQAAVLVLHHNNKNGIFRGSSSISAAVDLMLAVESDPGDTLIRLSCLKARDLAPAPFNARAHFAQDRFWLTPTDDQPAKLVPAARTILDYLVAHTHASTPQLMSAITSTAPANIRRLVHELTVSGHILRANGGKQGKLAVFQVSRKGLELLEK